jgi:hypothetical protein
MEIVTDLFKIHDCALKNAYLVYNYILCHIIRRLMSDFGDYAPISSDTGAPINQKLPYAESNMHRDDFNVLRTEVLADPYDVPETHYVELALRQWKMKPTEVAKTFFGVTNIKRIQKKLKREIYNRSYTKFRLEEDQNVLDLLQAMITVYNEYGKNLNQNIVRQVKILNEQTVQYIAPDMMTELKQHYGFLDSIKNPPNPLPDPINVNRAGRAQLPSIAQLYGL